MAGGLGALAWWAYRTDPHWVAKDGLAFTCRFQLIGGDFMQPEGRWREARAEIDESHLIVRQRGLFNSAMLRSGKLAAHYTVLKRQEGDDKYAVYLVDGEGVNGHEFAALRIPSKSRAVPHIDALVRMHGS
jgi:hypothetical protein